MIIVYTPEGGEPQQYDARTLRVSEVSIVQRTIDQRWPEIQNGLATEDLDCMRGVAWVLAKRTNPSLRWADFDPGVAEMVTRMDKREITAYVTDAVALAASDPDVTSEELAEVLSTLPAAALDREHAERVIAEMTAEGKDPAPAPEPEPLPQAADPDPSLTSTS